MGALKPCKVSTKQKQIAKLARKLPSRTLTTLAHHIDRDWLREAYRRTRQDGAVGVDGVTAEDYETELEQSLESLLQRFKCGTYRAPPVRRVMIPKGDGRKTRPIGIPTLEDKILQRAVLMVLEPVYEQSFSTRSFGFRPEKSCHQALKTLWSGLMSMGGGFVIDLDIRSFFDHIDHSQLREFLDKRIRDGVIRRQLDKWLRAGIATGGSIKRATLGTPQGGVISPLLANIYLDEVLDQWFANQVIPRMKGRATFVRFADDAVLIFEIKRDAERVMAVLAKRFGKYGLTLHPEKTKMISFAKPIQGRARKHHSMKSFNFLGFTHFWAKSRKGNWVVRQQTSKQSLRRAGKAISQWCRQFRNKPLSWQCQKLAKKLLGHYAYYGITGNARSLQKFYQHTRCTWRKWLGRRSQRAYIRWERFSQMEKYYALPKPVVVHSVYKT